MVIGRDQSRKNCRGFIFLQISAKVRNKELELRLKAKKQSLNNHEINFKQLLKLQLFKDAIKDCQVFKMRQEADQKISLLSYQIKSL
jgi:hypothetical protein